MKTYNDIYIATRNALRAAGIESYSLEARILLARASGKTPQELLRDMRLYTTGQVEQTVVDYTARRLAGEPVAYITGSWEFYGLPMTVTPDVLIPRADTEVLVESAVELLNGRKMDARVLDLCCGSGCIACAIGHELPAARLVCVDISATALEICRQNLAQNRLAARAQCIQADATASPPMSIGQFDLIVSNPPYIASAEILALDASVRDYEPIWALDGGRDGLKFYKAIIKYWKSLLPTGGAMLFEVGEGQAAAVCEMLLNAGFRSTGVKRDTRGVERAVIGIM